jgi:hypothetical protein
MFVSLIIQFSEPFIKRSEELIFVAQLSLQFSYLDFQFAIALCKVDLLVVYLFIEVRDETEDLLRFNLGDRH